MGALLIVVAAAISQAGGSARDKSGYSLVNPVPRELMREMSTDRPDTTESPRTVDAGHWQVEMSFVEYARERDGARVDSWAVASVNLKVGVLNNLDVQFVFEPYLVERERWQTELSGIGDLTVRTKWNLVGNDEDGRALGVMPFVKLPTGDDEVSNGAVEWGVIVPASFELSAGSSLGVMLEVDLVRNGDGGYDGELVHTAVLGRDLWEGVGGFVEYVGVAALTSGGSYRATANAGLTYGVTPDVQLDCGVGVGLTSAAEDFSVFAGISLRY